MPQIKKENHNILLLHGFKRSNKDDFKFFKEYLKNNFDNVNIIFFDYYNNNDKKTLSSKKIKESVLEFVENLELENISVVGYSLGALIGLTLFGDNEKVKKIYSLYPPLKIHLFDWIFKLWRKKKKAREIKKKLGKEKYKTISEKYKKNKIIEKYPVRIVFAINSFRFKYRNLISNNINKDIKIVFSSNDEVVKGSSLDYLKKKINFDNNQIEIEKNNFNHFTVFNTENNELFENIALFLNLIK